MNAEELITEIEEAFGRSSSCGLEITINSQMGDYPDVRKHFQQRDWWTCDAKFLKQQDGAFTFMTDEARVYFTPAFMIASLIDPVAADTVPDNFVSNLTETLLRRYDLPQLRAVSHFIEFSLSEDSWLDNGWRRKLTLAQSIDKTVVDNRLPVPSRNDHLDYNP